MGGCKQMMLLSQTLMFGCLATPSGFEIHNEPILPNSAILGTF